MVFGQSVRELEAGILHFALKGHSAAKKKKKEVARENAEQVRRSARRLGKKLQETEKEKAASIEAAAEDITSVMEMSRIREDLWQRVIAQFKLIESISLRWRLAHIGSVIMARKEVAQSPAQVEKPSNELKSDRKTK